MSKHLHRAAALFLSGVLSLLAGCSNTPAESSIIPTTSPAVPAAVTEPLPPPTDDAVPSDAQVSIEQGILVAYFSATGNTKAVAEAIAEPLGADLYEIVPETPYTSDDLNWTEPTSRTNKEHEDLTFRPAIAGEAKNLSGYDTIFIGYPLWWGKHPTSSGIL